MKVVLKQEVENIGKKGDIVEVSDGHARNFLLPQGVAEKATDATMKLAEKLKKQRAEEDAKRVEDLTKIFDGVKGMKIEVSAKAKEDGTLFGSIKAEEILKALNKKSKAEFDKDMIKLEEPIKQVGEHKVLVKVSKDLEAEIEIIVSQEK